MTSKISFFALSFALLIGQSAHANIEVNFFESAPKDSFTINNVGNCALDDLTLTLDLSNTAGKLIFDTSSAGAGVEVFQPFEAREGMISVSSPKGVNDGDNKLTVVIKTLPSGKSVSFTIDVDDTLAISALGNIRVADSEMQNGMVEVSSKDIQSTTALFDNKSKATLKLPPCKSS